MHEDKWVRKTTDPFVKSHAGHSLLTMKALGAGRAVERAGGRQGGLVRMRLHSNAAGAEQMP